MRICLVVHGFPPAERTGVENYTAALAASFARQDHDVEVFTTRRATWLPELSLRREPRSGYGVNWLTVNQGPREPRAALDSASIAQRFGAFLDRERPEVIHFQHFIKLGLGLVFEARKRGIPTLYTAHDYYAVCHRYTLLRPDLKHCDVRGDSMACARCDVALAFLNERPKLGDYQMGALPEQLESEERRVLDEILAGTSSHRGFDTDRIDAAFDLRNELDARRAEAFDALDLIVAPTRFLRDELVRGGLREERIEVLPYGIETSDLLDLPPVLQGASRPVHFGFFGGLAKHKGVHVVLEAFGRAQAKAELSIWGYSTDKPYTRRMRDAAARVGALWRGPYEREELPGLLADVDVVVAPSLWVENYPLVIREAFAAGRPVIATGFGAIPESVRDGVDGVLVEPGDPDSLAQAFRELSEDPDRVRSLARAIEPVKDVDVQARELMERYVTLARRGSQKRSVARAERSLPASLVSFVDRFEALSSLPNRELFSRAIVRLEKLRAGLGAPVARLGIEEMLLRALGSDSRSQVALRDSKLENAWMHDTLQSRQEAERVLAEERDWLRREERSLTEERDWLRDDRRSLTEERDWLRELLQATEERLSEREKELASTREEREWLRGIVDGKEKEVQWLRDVLEAREKELEWVRERLTGVLRSHGELERLSHDLRRSLEDSEKGNRELREDLLLTERNLTTTRDNLERVNSILRGSEENLKKTVTSLEQAEGRLAEREADLEEAQRDLEETREALSGTQKDLETTSDDLTQTEGELRRTEGDLTITRRNLEITQSNLTRVELQLRSAAELGLVSLAAQERIIGTEIVPLIEEIREIDGREELEEVLDALPEKHPELADVIRAAQLGRERMRELSAELEWRRREMRGAYEAYKRGLANLVLKRTGVGRTVAGWSDDAGDEGERPREASGA